MSSYTIHPVANIFPEMSDADYNRHRDSIRQQGQLEPAWILDGAIIDGKHRYRACQELGIELKTRPYTGDTSTAALINFVVALNKDRRHLTSGQLATSAVDIKKMLEMEAKERQLATLKQNQTDTVTQTFEERETGEAAEFAAQAVGTNRQYVYDAEKLEQEAPDLFEQVRSGEVSLPKAKQEYKKRERKKKLENQLPVAVDVNTSLLHGDCTMVAWPDDIDLIIADPPFGLTVGNSAGVRDGKGSWDEQTYNDLHEFNCRWLSIALDALKDNGSILIFGTIHNIFSVGHILKSSGMYIVRDIVWRKPFVQRQVNMNALVPSHELIIWARKGQRHTCNLDEITRDVWDFQPRAKFSHPTEKPETLIESLIKMASDTGDLVADPFMGSGTTPAIAKANNRQFWGVEQDEYWWKVATDRVNNI